MISPTVFAVNYCAQISNIRNNVKSSFSVLQNASEFDKEKLLSNSGLLTFSLLPLSGISWTINYAISHADSYENKMIAGRLVQLGFILALSVATTAFFGFNVYKNISELLSVNRDNVSRANQAFLSQGQPSRPSTIYQANQMPPQYEDVILDAATGFTRA